MIITNICAMCDQHMIKRKDGEYFCQNELCVLYNYVKKVIADLHIIAFNIQSMCKLNMVVEKNPLREIKKKVE